MPLLAADGEGRKTGPADDGRKSAEGGKAGAEKGAGDKAGGDKVQQQRPTQRRDVGYARLRIGPDGLPMPADRSRSQQAKQELDDAKDQLSQALGASSMPSTHAIENELWRDDDYRQAVLDMRRAHNDYDAVRKPIFDALRTEAYYKELEKKKREKERVINSLVLTGRGSFDWLFPHAMAALEVRKRMTREEIMALAQTPEVEDARQRLLNAAAKVRAIKNNYTAQTYNPEALKAAKADLDAARDRVRAAQTDYNAAVADESEYERLRAEWIAEFRRTGRAPTR